jgi:transcriptional regulator with XRE-family HTH domain
MPPRSTPSERQRRLGAELAKLRKAAGLSGEEASAVLGTERTRISHIEAGRVDVPRNGLYKLLRAYGCPEGAYFDGLMEIAQERGKGWWDEYRGLVGQAPLDLAELESRSSDIRVHDALSIPGMFQTREYAGAMIDAAGESTEPIDRYADFRVARQQVLDDPATRYHAVIYEAALRVHIGSPAIMRRQLLRLMELARRPNITIQVFPFERGGYAAFSKPFLFFHGATPELSTVYVENATGGSFLDDSSQVSLYAEMFDQLAALALAPVDPDTAPESHLEPDSLTLIQHIMYRM